jgi:RNA polymerase sigma factor (TIGR02999 family)
VTEHAAESAGELIERLRDGDPAARDALFALCYPELKRLARQRLMDAHRGPSLDTTSLVHDVYLKIAGMGPVAVASRGHFMAYAAQAMRSLIVDEFRTRSAQSHGGGAAHVTLDTDLGERLAGTTSEVLEIDQALGQLAQVDERLVRVVEMRYFAGYSEREIAEVLGVTVRTIRRDWQRARVLLAAALGR